MGEKYIGDLLEELDKAFQEHKLTVGELEDKSIPLELIREGFEYLNQIRIKKEVEQLNDSIKNFNVSSDRAARRLVWLTYVLIASTVLLICLTLIEMFFREEALWVKFIFTVLTLGLFFIVYFYKENKLKFTNRSE